MVESKELRFLRMVRVEEIIETSFTEMIKYFEKEYEEAIDTERLKSFFNKEDVLTLIVIAIKNLYSEEDLERLLEINKKLKKAHIIPRYEQLLSIIEKSLENYYALIPIRYHSTN